MNKPIVFTSLLSAGVLPACFCIPVFAENTVEEVVVTATRTAINAVDAPASVAVITAAEIDNMPGLHLNEIVSQVVGVESTKDGGRAGREFIKIRGMDSDFSLILINGRRMSSSNAIIRGNDFDYNTIPPSSIERVEIIRGPMSSLYGSDALGGVINIITKQPDNAWSGTVSTNFSSPEDDGGERLQIGLNTSGALIEDELFVNVSLNVSDQDAWMPFGENDSSGRDRSDVTALENRTGYSALTSLTWNFSDNQSLNVDLGHSEDERDGVFETTRRLSPFDVEVTRNNLGLTHSGEWGWGNTQLRYGFEEVELKEGVTDVAEISEINHIFDASGTQIFGSYRLTYGGEARVTELDSERDLLETGEASVSQQALFVQDEWRLSDKWTLTLGGREDFHEEFGTNFSPRAYLVHRVNQRLVVKGGVGEAFRAPSVLRLNEEYRLSSCRGSCFFIGNPDLEPETSENYELSALYQASGWNGEVTVFRSDIENLIERDFTNLLGQQDSRDVFTFQNTESARIEGVEVSASANLTQRFSLRANYSYLDAVDRGNDEDLLERPEHSLLLRLNWNLTEDLRTFVQYNYTGEQAIDGNLVLDSYNSLDLGMNYYLQDGIRFRFGINNINDNSFNNEASLRGYNQAPLSMYLGTSIDF